MHSRHRQLIFAALVVVCAIGAAAAIAAGVSGQARLVETSGAARAALTDAQADRRPMVVFRSMNPKGQVAVAPAGRTAGKLTYGPLSCERVHFAGGRGLCVALGKGIPAGYSAKVFGPDMRVRHEVGLEGVASRARVSQDGRYGSVTMFVAGHSYAREGAFSTATTLIDMATGEEIAELESFTVTKDGRQVTAVDMNYWGVTFGRQDSDRFYATLATGGKTYLIEGSVSGRTARVIHENVECPSLSPDGTRIAYKRRTGVGKRPWQLSVLDLETMRETALAEGRNFDDQAEWLDDDTVMYGLDEQIWVVPADGSGQPRRYIAGADSPAVVRW
jgi:hypothetical protein